MTKLKFLIRLFFNTNPAVFVLSVLQFFLGLASIFVDVKNACFIFIILLWQLFSIWQESAYKNLNKKYIELLKERK